MLTGDDIGLLSRQDDATLVQWWNTLNRWEWPAEIADEEPPRIGMSEAGPHAGRRRALMNWISETVGMRACLRYGDNTRMSNAEFNDFWRGCYCGDTKAYARYEERLMQEATEEEACQ